MVLYPFLYGIHLCAARRCDKAHSSYEYKLKTQREIIENCPTSCMSTHATEKTYLIQITR